MSYAVRLCQEKGEEELDREQRREDLKGGKGEMVQLHFNIDS